MERVAENGVPMRILLQRVNQLIDGRTNAVGTVSLTPGATSTVVTSPIFNANAVPILFPQTANAAAALATTYAAITPGGGSFTITHANAVSSDRTFSYIVLGG